MKSSRLWRVAAFLGLAAVLAAVVGRGARDDEAAVGRTSAAAGAEAEPSGQAQSASKSGDRRPDEEGASAARETEETAEERERKARVARAMDLAGIRSLITTLKSSAAERNSAIRDSTLRGLRRYGATAKPLLEEHLSTAENDEVRKALTEALESAQ
jgi:hypothetical protein